MQSCNKLQRYSLKTNGVFCTPRHFSNVILNAHIWLTQPLWLDHQNFSEALHDCYSEKSGLVWFGLVWFGLVWFGLVWFGLVWFGLVWFGLAPGHPCCALSLVYDRNIQFFQKKLPGFTYFFIFLSTKPYFRVFSRHDIKPRFTA